MRRLFATLFLSSFLATSLLVPGYAQTAGGTCPTGATAGPDTNGNTLKCTSGTWVTVTPSPDVPSGGIIAFAATSCPTGWSEYTAARGRFLRGLDNGAGNDPDGTRTPGATQADMVGPHLHAIPGQIVFGNGSGGTANPVTNAGNQFQPGSTTSSNGTAETRPKNVAVLFCQKN